MCFYEKKYEKTNLANGCHSMSRAFDLETSCHRIQFQSPQVLPLDPLGPTQRECFSRMMLVRELAAKE